MDIAVIGAGAVGTLYGGWLLAGGAKVSFVARGQRLATLRRDGISLNGGGRNWRNANVTAVEKIADISPVDVILIATKLYDLPHAATTASEGLAPGGLVVGLQNGVSAAGTLAQQFAPEQIMVGPVYSAAAIRDDGTIDYSGKRNLVAIGSPFGQPHARAAQLVGHWVAAGVEAVVVPDIRHVLWTKFLGFATNAALTCLSRQSAGTVYSDPDLLGLAERSMGEILAIARAEGIKLPSNAVAETIALLRSFPPDMVASMRQDLDAGRRLELDGVSGEICRLGRKHDIPTPLHDTVYACLKPYRDGGYQPLPKEFAL